MPSRRIGRRQTLFLTDAVVAINIGSGQSGDGNSTVRMRIPCVFPVRTRIVSGASRLSDVGRSDYIWKFPDFPALFPASAAPPSSETARKFPGCRSLRFARRTKVIGCSMSVAEKAEASNAGEQLAKEYSAGNSSHRWETGGVIAPPVLPLPHRDDRFPHA